MRAAKYTEEEKKERKKQYNQKYRQENKEKMQQILKKYYEKNKPEILKKQKQYFKDNPEQYKKMIDNQNEATKVGKLLYKVNKNYYEELLSILNQKNVPNTTK